ncbi:MAG: prolyl oligopeptidase family serine peptidase [Saprospiraceae bacterium]|nr:prolyl oligopeptidase family serine peptidase [Saprospiraceae bacterium]
MKNLIYLLLLAMTLPSCKKEEARQTKLYTIEQFYANTRFGGGTFSGDETRLLINSDTSGIFNLYEISLNDGIQKQMTNSTVESFFSIDYVPGSKAVLYSANKGGNEIDHIYLLDEDGKTTDLTPGENEKASFFKWSQDKKSMFYSSNLRDPKYFDVYKSLIGEWKPVLLYENKDGLNVEDISEDEKIMAISKTITTSENELYLVNRETGAKTELSQLDQKGRYEISGFSKDNRYAFYITNAGKEFAYLVQYDMASGERKVLFETKWDVMYSFLSEKETYRVIAINEDGKNTIIMQDASTGKTIDFPEIPDGDILGVEISDSEKLMRLSVGTSKAPNNIYLYNLETKELKKLTESLNKEINADDLTAAEVVRFKSFDGVEIPAIYYKPHQATPNQKVPALVWVHGGPGGQSRTGYFALIQYLVNHGYAVLAVNNRGSSGYGKTFYKMDDRNHGDKDLKDCIAGKNWLASQDYIDGERIGIIGGSYGGYMTMAAMTFTPDEFNVGVNIFGVTNWLRTLKSIPPYWESFRNALYTEMGDPTTEDSVRLYNISPLFHAHQVKNPVMVLQGANDPRVLQIESDEIVEAIKKNNIPVEYVVFPDEGHGFVKKENEIKGYGDILKFLDTHLKETVKN